MSRMSEDLYYDVKFEVAKAKTSSFYGSKSEQYLRIIVDSFDRAEQEVRYGKKRVYTNLEINISETHDPQIFLIHHNSPLRAIVREILPITSREEIEQPKDIADALPLVIGPKDLIYKSIQVALASSVVGQSKDYNYRFDDTSRPLADIIMKGSSLKDQFVISRELVQQSLRDVLESTGIDTADSFQLVSGSQAVMIVNQREYKAGNGDREASASESLIVFRKEFPSLSTVTKSLQGIVDLQRSRDFRSGVEYAQVLNSGLDDNDISTAVRIVESKTPQIFRPYPIRSSVKPTQGINLDL